ncbi:MAG TPA: tRNA (adenosine(37)-N6)-threonylcarbamoyltransferase complex ATPase subunit type 1 TsaE [Sphaerochaeta sp.]|nr:tRNA (adenosine(37)-N6)-threonylcarbamoyltransferase complex ATPase subunit type 1 TsaE [Spirochaetota bacterium]NLV60548.1 tRNA (adenosine(37)-N6)-threonylcarbamoyltransferase complex ATPase subunit type 1 TsaE [Spirochaetales bacterium]HOE83710.1 tRNA (adenosine(37)-N6)-threonylcarbamoyltransferase complex ATPase subunit type 1 TsaE [Sphaerochaeta sp.]HOQ93670.1 tRNA (adenosine(37)-N6)-threonylcarbamoyltransferase complex ATPase subunit type 1 TsaE [Sphaerochaeta sp.]HPK46476.1 tRNA (adeno
MKSFVSTSALETTAYGERIAAHLKGGEVIALIGGLGAGKTTLAKGIARGLGVEDEVVSPSFTLIQQYEGRLALTHIDLYRLDGSEEFEMIGGEEFLYTDGVTLIEWAEKIGDLLPKDLKKITIAIEENLDRTITVEGITL